MTDEEMISAESFKGYYKIVSDIRDLNYDLYFNKGKLKKIKQSYSSDTAKQLSENDLLIILAKMKLSLEK